MAKKARFAVEYDYGYYYKITWAGCGLSRTCPLDNVEYFITRRQRPNRMETKTQIKWELAIGTVLGLAIFIPILIALWSTKLLSRYLRGCRHLHQLAASSSFVLWVVSPVNGEQEAA